MAYLVVDGKVLVELKTGKELIPWHEAQLLHYLKATGIEVGLLVNFGREKGYSVLHEKGSKTRPFVPQGRPRGARGLR